MATLALRILQLILFSCLLAAGASVASQALPGCKHECGNLSIPYPFGMIPGCQVEILNYVAKDCYNHNGTNADWNFPQLRASMFTISNDRNNFIAVGCDTKAQIWDEREHNNSTYFTGSMAYCEKMDALHLHGSYSGVGCCQVSIPSGLKNLNMSVLSYYNHTRVWDFNPCSYAFVVDESKFSFSDKSFGELAHKEFLPMALDWAIGNEPCNVSEHKPDYACKQNSICYNPENRSRVSLQVQGWLPWKPISSRWSDLFSFDDFQILMSAKIRAYTIVFLKGTVLIRLEVIDVFAQKAFMGMAKKIERAACEIKQMTDFSFCLDFVVVGSSWLFFINKKRKLLNMKKFFKQNGGLLLQQELHERVSTETVKIFTAEALKNATKNYDESQIIGKGGNVVKLLGCCLETEVPLLVYEFVSNGTLSEHIHCEDKASSISWAIRLRIATESAQVLSYLHFAASIPIIHRDVKPTNILFGRQLYCKSFVLRSFTVSSDGSNSVINNGPEEERNLANHFVLWLKNDRFFEILDDKVAKEGVVEQIKEVAKLPKKCLNVKGNRVSAWRNIDVSTNNSSQGFTTMAV
ncbi:hypothetical protein GOBAR_DD06435 [Gossypium barbadense]|nr:hypothetical protein GOBAR_DD06435 [Gossypium barbadense]